MEILFGTFAGLIIDSYELGGGDISIYNTPTRSASASYPLLRSLEQCYIWKAPVGSSDPRSGYRPSTPCRGLIDTAPLIALLIRMRPEISYAPKGSVECETVKQKYLTCSLGRVSQLLDFLNLL